MRLDDFKLFLYLVFLYAIAHIRMFTEFPQGCKLAGKQS